MSLIVGIFSLPRSIKSIAKTDSRREAMWGGAKFSASLMTQAGIWDLGSGTD
jgi:hypothetical protein